MSRSAGKHQRTLHREAPVIDISSRRAAEETAWRIKSVKLERDRHAQQRHLNPLNMADTFGHLIASFKGRHQDAILVIGEDTLEVFIEGAETNNERSGSRKMKKFLSKVVSRKHDDSSDDEAPAESASGVGDAEEALDGHLFSVGVAFAQILQLSQHGKAITIYYHPNSFSSTQSVRSNLASCWRFTVALDSAEEADGVMSDIRLQLARYAQGIHWVQKNFLLDESISAILVTCGPPGPTDCPNPQQALSLLSPKSTHIILQMDPEFEMPFAAPDSWNMPLKAGEVSEVIRVFLQTPTGCCHVDITRAVLQSHLKADRGQFYITATARPPNNEVSMEALEKRKNKIDEYLVHNSGRSRLAHWTSNAGSTVSESGLDEGSAAPTPRENSRQSLADPSGYQSDASYTEGGPSRDGRSPRSGRLRGGFAYSDRPILGQSPERSHSFTEQRQKLQLSNLGASPPSQAEETQQAMRRVASWSSATGSPKKQLSIDTTSHMTADATGQSDMPSVAPADQEGSAMGPRRMTSVRFAEGQMGSSGAQASPRSAVLASAATLHVRLHCRAQRVARQAPTPPEPSQPSGHHHSNSQQMQSLDQLAYQQPQSIGEIIADPAIWIGYTPLTVILILVLRILGLRLWNSAFGSILITAICVLYAAQQRLLLGRQELMAVRRTKQAVTAAGAKGQQQQQAKVEVPQQPKTQIMLTLLGAEIADNFSSEDVGDMYDDDTVSEMSLEMGEEAGPAFEARAQAQSLAGVGPSVGPGVVAESQVQNSGLRRFSKDHAVSDDTQKRFMIAVENDEKAAKKRVQDMLEWKRKHQLDICLQTPKPNFDTMKKAILHGIICFSKTNHPIRLMRVGDMRQGWKKMKAAGISSDDGLRHFGFVEEYIWQVLDPNPHPLGTAIWIVDLGGMGLSDLGSEAFQFFKRMSVEVGFHYPERLYKLVLLNSPSFFSLLWKICEPIMPGNTRNKVKVVRSHQELISALADECDQSEIPTEYGGTSPTALYESKIEVEMRDFVRNLG